MADHINVTAEEFYEIFGDSDEENDGEEENPDDYGSDLDLNVLADEEELDSKNESEYSAKDYEWSEEFQDFEPETFDESNSGIKVPIPDGSGALYFFILLLGKATIVLVIEETNCMARQKLTKKPERNAQWRDVLRLEFMAYLRLCIIMGINKLPKFSDYWTSDPFLENRGVKSVMTKHCFE